MRRFWTLFLCFVCTASASAQAADFSTARQIIRDGMARESAPAVVVAIARGDSILWIEAFGYANRETRVPATIHTPFYLASLSKTITATAAMVLREQGRLDLDRPANDYLGNARLTSPAWSANGATLRRLATHTSGLTTFDVGCSTGCEPPSHDEIIRQYGVLMWPPAEHFDYSNLGYLVLGDAIARAARSDLGSLLRDDVFRPLGMVDASLGIDRQRENETAVQYSWTRGALPRESRIVSGGSSVYASAYDVVRFGMMHAKAHVAGAKAILSDAAIDTMQNSTVPADGNQQYGLGWWIETDRYGYRSVLAQGGTDASSTWLRIIPSERVVAVVLANKGVGFSSEVVDAMIAALLPRYADGLAAQKARSLAARSTPAPNPATPRLDSAYVGTWHGVVRAEQGDLPLEIVVSDSGSLCARVGAEASERMGRATFATGLFRLRVPGDLQSADTTGGRQLAFYLRPRGGVVNGTVTTNPNIASHLVGRFSYWVELRKIIGP